LKIPENIHEPQEHMLTLLLQLPVQSVPITTKVVSLNPVHVKVYLIQHCLSVTCDRSVVFSAYSSFLHQMLVPTVLSNIHIKGLVYSINAIFNNISVASWQSVLLVEETGVRRKNHRPVTSH
jgi:hypothetical protein